MTAGYGKTDGPITSGTSYSPYGEANVGYEVAVGGTWSGNSYPTYTDAMSHINNPTSSGSITVLLTIGVGYGAYVGVGVSKNVIFANHPFGGNKETCMSCKQ